MGQPDSVRGRAWRAAVFALAALLLGLTAHIAAHGNAPTLAADLVALVAAMAVGVVLARRERQFRSLAAAMAALQVGMHAAFTALMASRPGECCTPKGIAGALAKVPLQHVLCAVGATPQAGVAVASTSVFLGAAFWVMTALHLVAALALAGLLAMGESAVWSWARSAGISLRWLRLLEVPVDVPVLCRRPSWPAPPAFRTLSELFRVVELRGPPAHA